MRRTSQISRALAALLLTALFATMVPLSTAAQTPEPDTERRVIEVEGTGTVQLDPDTADVNLGVITQNESLQTAQEENSATVQQIMDALSTNGVAEEDITTSGYWIYPVHEFDENGNMLGVTGYQVSTTLTVTIRDTEVVGSVLDAAVSAGANQIARQGRRAGCRVRCHRDRCLLHQGSLLAGGDAGSLRRAGRGGVARWWQRGAGFAGSGVGNGSRPGRVRDRPAARIGRTE